MTATISDLAQVGEDFKRVFIESVQSRHGGNFAAGQLGDTAVSAITGNISVSPDGFFSSGADGASQIGSVTVTVSEQTRTSLNGVDTVDIVGLLNYGFACSKRPPRGMWHSRFIKGMEYRTGAGYIESSMANFYSSYKGNKDFRIISISCFQ